MFFILKQLALLISVTGWASFVLAPGMETSCTFMETPRHVFVRRHWKDATLMMVFPLFGGLFGFG